MGQLTSFEAGGVTTHYIYRYLDVHIKVMLHDLSSPINKLVENWVVYVEV